LARQTQNTVTRQTCSTLNISRQIFFAQIHQFSIRPCFTANTLFCASKSAEDHFRFNHGLHQSSVRNRTCIDRIGAIIVCLHASGTCSSSVLLFATLIGSLLIVSQVEVRLCCEEKFFCFGSGNTLESIDYEVLTRSQFDCSIRLARKERSFDSIGFRFHSFNRVHFHEVT
jgi:hypothetical protein